MSDQLLEWRDRLDAGPLAPIIFRGSPQRISIAHKAALRRIFYKVSACTKVSRPVGKTFSTTLQWCVATTTTLKKSRISAYLEASSTMAIVNQPNLPVLDSTSSPPDLFDGTTRLYISLRCPFAQRAWSARNFKGLDNIELVAISLVDKPKWYLEKVYPVGKVPSLEHNDKVTGESLDLLEYIDQNFDGPSLFPKGVGAAKDLLKFSDEVVKQVFTAFRNKEAKTAYAEEHIGPVLDHLETALEKFEDEGPYFLGQLSAVDLAYAPFFERFELLAPELLNYDIYSGRPRLAKWFKVMNTVDAYTITKSEPKSLAEQLKKYFGR